MSRIRYFLYGLILSTIFIGGCEEFLTQGDKIAAGTKQITEQGQVILDSPAGALIPPEIRLAIEVGGALAAAIALAWEQWRLKNMTQTTKSIVTGIELSEQRNNPQPQSANVKEKIGEVMKLASKMSGVSYDRQNKIVDKLKIA